MTQAQLDFHNMTSQVTQKQIDLQNQLEMHTADLITKLLSNDSPVLFILKKRLMIPFLIKWNTEIFLQKIKHLRIMINLLILLHQQKRNKKIRKTLHFFHHQSIHQKYLQDHNSLRPVMTILYQYFLQTAFLSNHN